MGATDHGKRPPLGQVALKGLLALLVTFLMLTLVAGVAFLAYEAHYAGAIYQGVTVLGVDVGGLTREQASARLRQELEGVTLPYVTLHTADQAWTVSTDKLGGYLDLEQAVQEAWNLGRSGIFRGDLRMRARLLWWGYNVVPAFHLEPGVALVTLRQVAGWTGHPARRAQLAVAGLQAHTGTSETGRELNIGATLAAIEHEVYQALGHSSWQEQPVLLRLQRYAPPKAAHFPVEPIRVALVFNELVPPLTEVAGAQERVGLILSAPLTLIVSREELLPDGSTRRLDDRWSVDQAELASWLMLRTVQAATGNTVEVDVDRDKIKATLQIISDQVARPPREARFDYDPAAQVLRILTPGQVGYALNLDTAREMVARACFATEKEVILPVTVIPPRVSQQDLEALMPLTLISEGASSFQGSKPERAQNIRVATARFHGLTIPPQTTFSFLENLGPVTVANGYSESLIIYGERTVLGAGGGVCQVSTTCFRAAFWGGYPILERSPHSYRVAWYEPPVGLDAAVFSPQVDMKFRNDTATPILIQTQVDEQSGKVYFRFYGRSPGRKVTMEGPTISNPVKAPAPIYEEDPSLAPGASVQVEWPHDGLDVTLTRVVEQGGVVVARDKFFSRYEPWPARYRVGPREATTSP